VIIYWAQTGKMSDTITGIDPDSELEIGKGEFQNNIWNFKKII
jgi:hypothetical protein